MNLLDWLVKLAGAKDGSGLIVLLEKGGDVAPDLKPVADEWIAKLNAAASIENLAAVAPALVAELSNIAQGKIEPRDSPSNAI